MNHRTPMTPPSVPSFRISPLFILCLYAPLFFMDIILYRIFYIKLFIGHPLLRSVWYLCAEVAIGYFVFKLFLRWVVVDVLFCTVLCLLTIYPLSGLFSSFTLLPQNADQRFMTINFGVMLPLILYFFALFLCPAYILWTSIRPMVHKWNSTRNEKMRQGKELSDAIKRRKANRSANQS